jgi:hypothetical protein
MNKQKWRCIVELDINDCNESDYESIQSYLNDVFFRNDFLVLYNKNGSKEIGNVNVLSVLVPSQGVVFLKPKTK